MGGGHTGPFLKPGRHDLTVVPCVASMGGYIFIVGSGVLADLSFNVDSSGNVNIPTSCTGFMSCSGNTLTISGYSVVVDATKADSDLLGLINTGPPAITPRYVFGVLVPAKSYRPQTVNGQFNHGFQLHQDGTIVIDAGVPPTSMSVTKSVGVVAIDGKTHL